MLAYQFLPAGDKAVNITFERRVSSVINQQILKLQQRLKNLNVEGITGFLPAFRTLTIFYDPVQVSLAQLKKIVNAAILDGHQLAVSPSKRVHIPVCYDSSFGPDLDTIAKQSHLSREKVIERHSQQDYLIYMLGFLPGFAYLGGLDPDLATPRLATPRLKIAPGSVGIAGEQTGMYPIESPGGWQIIGRTPLHLFQPESAHPFYYQAGDYIHFDVISRSEYNDIAAHLEDYHVQVDTLPTMEMGVSQHGA
ncbi:5-oxoprolinase subunit PxpB [Secundilactobacillus folii]|uniref:5-oxoprolinase subunit PxpB n=1 Tax=Secundilactobacillus folii TaxID=2678357 RepID=A0A7X2XTU5_9LACO|nr:5-oxoprolinase subunit PxpB [Secundilactobacillus folii]